MCSSLTLKLEAQANQRYWGQPQWEKKKQIFKYKKKKTYSPDIYLTNNCAFSHILWKTNNLLTDSLIKILCFRQLRSERVCYQSTTSGNIHIHLHLFCNDTQVLKTKFPKPSLLDSSTFGFFQRFPNNLWSTLMSFHQKQNPVVV